jgi:hypothetical protein
MQAGKPCGNGLVEGKLWRPKRQRIEKIHEWRQRRSRAGEMVQWDTSEHAWLEDRPKLYLISMTDDATSRIHARFVLHDSTEENMRLLWSYLEGHGRPLSFYPDKASLYLIRDSDVRTAVEFRASIVCVKVGDSKTRNRI